jgi:transcriptional regulator with XRE-family HTH domain
MTIRDAIVNLRLQLDLSQRELAEKAGIDERSVRRYEAGRAYPDPAPLAAFASLASQAGLHQLANVFGAALVHRLDLDKLDVFVAKSGRAAQQIIDERHGLAYEQPIGPLYSFLLISKQGDDAALVSAVADALALLFYSHDEQARARAREALRRGLSVSAPHHESCDAAPTRGGRRPARGGA